MTSATGQVWEFLHDRILSNQIHTSYWENPPIAGVSFVMSGRIGTKREINSRGREWTVENESSICAFSGKSREEFVRQDENWLCLCIFRQIWSGVCAERENLRHCAGVGAGGVKKTKHRGTSGVQGFWRGNGEESRIQDRARVRSNYLRAVLCQALQQQTWFPWFIKWIWVRGHRILIQYKLARSLGPKQQPPTWVRSHRCLQLLHKGKCYAVSRGLYHVHPNCRPGQHRKTSHLTKVTSLFIKTVDLFFL